MDRADWLPPPSEDYQAEHPGWDTPVSEAARTAPPAEAVPPEFADEALALRFSRRHANELRYVAAWGRWLIWDGKAWRFDETLRAFDLARAVCREASAECESNRVASAIASAKTVASVERLAKSDRRHAATVEQWDAEPWLLNTPEGIVDLRTGALGPHKPDVYMTKIAAVAPGGGCPLWHQFLARITGGDLELQGFLQRVFGYALTGVTREHALFFGYGTGANGKGTALNTMTGILGAYAAVAPMEVFVASPGDRHPTELAMLRGARLVAAQETEEGRQWAEARIKALTGGDPITARFMRQDFFTFSPQFKLFIAGNHKPGLRGVDEAIRRRLNLIPFTVTIPASERDASLSDKLKAEWSGILAWAIQGCLEWQHRGLQPPSAVMAATADYLSAEDSLARWISERCRQIGYGGTECTALYQDWCRWMSASGEHPGSQKRFSQALEAKGYQKDPKARHATFIGIALDDVQRPFSETAEDRA